MALTSASSFVADTSGHTRDARHEMGNFGGDLLVPLVTTDVPSVTDQLGVAAALARTARASLHVVSPLTDSDGTVPTETHVTDDSERELLDWVTDHVSESDRGWDGIGYTRSLVSNIRSRLRTTDVDTLVVPGGAVSRFRCGLVERVAARAECDVITVNGRHGFEDVPSILLAVADGPHSTLATDLAAEIAADCDAWIDVLHVINENATEDRRERATERVEAAVSRIDRPEATTTWILEADDVADTIVEQSAYYGLTVIGAPTKSRLRRFVFGSTNRAIRSDADSVVLSARQHSYGRL